MKQKITGKLSINFRDVSFLFDGKDIALVNDDEPSVAISFGRGQPEDYDIVKGITDTNQDIVFFGVRYARGRSISAQGWAVGKGGSMRDGITAFDAIRFEGIPVDVFFTPGRAIAYDHKARTRMQMPSAIIFRHPKNFERIINVIVDKEPISIKISVGTRYGGAPHGRDIASVVSYLAFRFQKPVSIANAPKYYLYACDLIQFISFRQNYNFDNITLYDTFTSGRLTGKQYKFASCHFFKKEYRREYANTIYNSIIFDEIETSFKELFEHVVSRRLNGVVTDDLYVPETDADNNRVNHVDFLSCALSFEGEYSRRFPGQKSSTDELFKDIKVKVLTSINSAYSYYKFPQSNKMKKRAVGYFSRLIRAVESTDNSLEEKFNDIRERYKGIVSSYIDRVIRGENNTDVREGKLGSALAEMRNSIAHGAPIPMERLHVAAYKVTRCFIYVLILDNAGVPHDTITNIIEKLFRA